MHFDRSRTSADRIAPDCAGMDFDAADHRRRDLLVLHVPADVRATLEPHWVRLVEAATALVLCESAATWDEVAPLSAA
jgi:hypothetical protein